MQNEPIKATIIQGYLNQQLQQTNLSDSSEGGGGMLTTIDIPTNNMLDEFKTQVRLWMEIDNNIRKLQQAIRERKELKKQVTEKVLSFMARYNIEDLNTREGKLRYKVTQVKPSVSQRAIKEKLVENYSKARSCEELLEKVFNSGDRMEKPCLRRVQVKSVKTVSQ